MNEDKINQTFASLRQLYPDDIASIEAEEKRVHDLLAMKEYAANPQTQTLVRLCRADVVFARVRLATNRQLDEKARNELWHLIDSRLWFIQLVARDFDGELATIEGELRAELEA